MKKKTKFISFYQYDCDDPVIITHDLPEAARKEARKDIRRTVINRQERKESLKHFDQHGSVSFDKIVIFASECEYRPTVKWA